jgi:hypothetical protein
VFKFSEFQYTPRTGAENRNQSVDSACKEAHVLYRTVSHHADASRPYGRESAVE